MAERAQLVAWLQASAAGDRQAFRQLYDATAPQLYALLMRMLRHPDVAEDALQETYLKVWQKARLYSPAKGSPLTWLLSIARYRALDTLRHRRSAALAEGDVSDEATARHEPVTENETSQLWEVMQNCLTRLQSSQRKSVLLAYYEGLTHQELAERMSAPLGTVKSWVRRGLSGLRDCLSRDE